MRVLLLVVALGFTQALLRPSPSSAETAPLAERFPGALQTVLFSGFRPFLVQYLWFDLASAWSDRRYLEVLADLRVLTDVEPDNPEARMFAARLLALDLAPREARPRGRFARIGDALALLAEGERRMPSDPRLPLLRSTLLRGHWIGEAALRRLYREAHHTTPSADAWEAARRAHLLAPGATAVADYAADAGYERAIELLTLGDPAGAHEVLAGAADVLPPESSAPAGRLLPSWMRVAAAMSEADPEAAAEGALALVAALEALPDPDAGDPLRHELLALTLPSTLLPLVSRALEEDRPAAALSLLEALHNIQTLVAARLGRAGDGVPSPAPGDVRAWNAAVDDLIRRNPDGEASLERLRLPESH